MVGGVDGVDNIRGAWPKSIAGRASTRQKNLRLQWGTLQGEVLLLFSWMPSFRKAWPRASGTKRTPSSPVGRKGNTHLSVCLDPLAYEEVASGSTHPVQPEHFMLRIHKFVVPLSQGSFALITPHTEGNIRGVRIGVYRLWQCLSLLPRASVDLHFQHSEQIFFCIPHGGCLRAWTDVHMTG
jgi:hypothetical protein